MRSRLKALSKTFRLDRPGQLIRYGLGEWRMDSLVSVGWQGRIAAASAAAGLIEVADPIWQADARPEPC